MNPLSEVIETLGFTSVWTFLLLFLAASLLMIWRLEALLDHGLEGTALGTLIMPYCSGLGNLIFVALVATRDSSGQDVLTNCVVNNVTNLTIILAVPTLIWGLQLGQGAKKKGKAGMGKKNAARAGAEQELTRLSLLLTLAAVLFFTGITWALSADGRLDRGDGIVLIALFLFWQCFQVFDVLKHNVRQRRRFGPMFYLDLFVVLLGAGALYSSIDWLVKWLEGQEGTFINGNNLGWLSGWLMVIPNALLAFFYAARRRPDIVYASQVGDGHICIPLCLGFGAVLQPLSIPPFFQTGVFILAGTAIVHGGCMLASNGLPKWMGWPLLAAYAWFLGAGFFS